MVTYVKPSDYGSCVRHLALKHVYYVPKEFGQSEEHGEVLRLLTKVSETLSIPFEDHPLENESAEQKVKMKLLPLAVRERLRIHQSAKGKSLYPHLLVLSEDDPVAFFPQIRREKGRRLEVRASEYLNSLLNGSLKSLVPIPAIEAKVPSKEDVSRKVLKEGYLKTAVETRRIMREWSSVESTWPE
jgi:hypothetical protein